MWDVWVADLLLVFAIPIFTFRTLRSRTLEQLTRYDSILPPASEVQANYEARYRIRLIFALVLPTILATFFCGRLMLLPPNSIGSVPPSNQVGSALLESAVLGILILLIWDVKTRRLVNQKHPDLSVHILRSRWTDAKTLWGALCIGFFGLFILTSSDAYYFLSQSWFLVEVLADTYGSRKEQLETQQFTEILKDLGAPKTTIKAEISLEIRTTELRSESLTVPSVIFSILSETELAAYVARSAFPFKKSQQNFIWPSIIIFWFAFYLGVFWWFKFLLATKGDGAAAFVIPIGCLSLFPLCHLTMWLIARTNRSEILCHDRQIAQLGYGPDLATGLEKLARYQGNPHHWVGLDKFTSAQPSISERIEALGHAPSSIQEAPNVVV